MTTLKIQAPVQNNIYNTVFLASVFFITMVLMEVLVEGTFQVYGADVGNTLPAAVTFAQFLACFLVPLSIKPETINSIPTSPREIFPYFILSCLVFGATALATASLQYVPYSVKIIFKSAKLIPTMIVSSCMHNTKYNAREYIAALFLCVGAMGYAYNPGKSSAVTTANTFGIIILTISAFCDALVPNIQQDMMSKSISAEELMVNTNVVGLVCVSIYMLITGDFIKMISLSHTYPFLCANLAGVGICLAVAVMCYTSLIKRAGSVVAVSIGTMRKIITIALSYVLFPKEFLPIHALASLCVVIGILLEGCKPAKPSKASEPHPSSPKDSSINLQDIAEHNNKV